LRASQQFIPETPVADNGKPQPMSAGRYKTRPGLSCLRGDGGWVPAILARYVDVLAGGVSMCYIENQVDTIFIRQVQQ
jgi:hypothetical protein